MIVAGTVCAVAAGVFLLLFFASWDTLEFQEMGLNYSFLSQRIEKRTYSSGRYYLGVGNSFLKFPQMVKSVYFLDDVTGASQGPALKSRTKDGLNVQLEVSFQYRLLFDEIYDLYMNLGPDYEKTLVRMSIEQLAVSATMYTAHNFFSNRTIIGQEMHKMLEEHFAVHAHAEVPFFQLRTVHLPNMFEDAIQETQVRQQEIQIATAEQHQNRVKYETRVIQAEQAVHVLANQASAEAQSLLAANNAFCRQYNITQSLQSDALQKLQQTAGWDSAQLLDYMRVRAIRDHPSSKTTIQM